MMAGPRLADTTVCVYLLLFLSARIPEAWLLHVIPGYENEKACYGTSTGFANNGDSNSRYQKYKDAYTDCTYVVGNLEIVFLESRDTDYDMSFLSQIKEVTGYVLLAGNFVDYIPLTSLQIIRGSTLFHHNKTKTDYSLFVALNYDTSGARGLKELRFTSLSEILAGKVFFQNNDVLCFENTIEWADINPNTKPPVQFVHDSKAATTRPCGECHDKCLNNITQRKHCWGEGPDMCQKLNYGNVCHSNCVGRCYGSKPYECCHQECAGGCTGPKKTDCFACRTFKDDNGCEPSCPKEKVYDKEKMIIVPNQNPKYAFGSLCVKECPGFLLQDLGACVRQCSEGKHSVDQRTCQPCNGPCPKICDGNNAVDYVNSENIHQFQDCTLVQGNLKIITATFERDDHYNIEPLHPSNLTVLKHVKEITGYVLIQSKHPEFTNLSFLSSLTVIHGRTASETKGFALNIISTPLQSLELVSLKQISNGNVIIALNPNLCYADTIDWRKILKHPEQKFNITSNRPRAECEIAGEECEQQCGTSGCWGKGPNNCLECANYVYEEQSLCLNKCTDIPRLYHNGQGKCMKCHEQCANTCTGPNNTDCDKCAQVTMRNIHGKDSCEQSCELVMYPDENRVCQACHPFCRENGCTGPGKHYGPGGCNKCDLGIRSLESETNNTVECTDSDECTDGYFQSYIPLANGNGFQFCERCHEYCLTCLDPTPQHCSECRYFRKDKYCVKTCPSFDFGNTQTKKCQSCHSECRTGCVGPTSADCLACANFKIYTSMDNKTFNCTPECPANLPYRVKEIETDENRVVCADSSHPEVQAFRAKNAEEERQKLIIILAVTVPVAVFIVAMLILITYMCHKRAQNNMKAAKYTAKMVGFEEIEPLTPTNAKPDLAQMRIINESELRKGAIIGSGAFGTVYKGIWIPQGENVKIPVAIKVLQEGTSPGQSTELLEEARVMCSVDNICCVRILAVCMKSQMMLVTQLMPHGNLLNYVRTNAQHIGSKALLNWCTQIARGMAYLEERGIVHRDLAARNVLVQTPNQVKITDFGLAKLLDSDSLEYHSSGGLMPIKWLALECILHRIFTHKSDVWSYGITVWELFTLGKKPYDGVRTKDVPVLLEKGERLQQPIICTIDVYMIMVKCWMLDADSRPSFKELQEEFAKMSRDPGRYLVIEGDEHHRFPDSAYSSSELDVSMDAVLRDPVLSTSRAETAGVLSAAGTIKGAQGDALMRLPSVSYDKNELIHEISGGGSESVMDAEEYLRPVDHRGQNRPGSLVRPYDRQPSNTSVVSPRSSSSHNDFTEGAKGGSLGRESQKVREKKYGHLRAAVRAKQEREQPEHRDDNVSSRYSSDPIKFLRDKEEIDWNQSDAPTDVDSFIQHPRSPELPANIVLPVDDEDYLRPGAAAQSLAYLDLDGKGYYQNEKETAAVKSTDDGEHTLDHLIAFPSDDSSHQQKKAGVAVANPDYFEEDTDIWEQKKPLHNGYHPVSTTSTSPVHAGGKDADSAYYRGMNGTVNSSPNPSKMVNTRVIIPGVKLDSPESKV